METYIIMSGLIAVFLAISAVIGYRDEKQRDQKARRSLAEAFGKPGSKEYPDGRLAQIRVTWIWIWSITVWTPPAAARVRSICMIC